MSDPTEPRPTMCRHCGDPIRRGDSGEWAHIVGKGILYNCQHTVPYGQVAEPRPAASPGEVETPNECLSCGEGDPRNECPRSKRPCGHHCNHVWTHDGCDWCGHDNADDDASLLGSRDDDQRGEVERDEATEVTVGALDNLYRDVRANPDVDDAYAHAAKRVREALVDGSLVLRPGPRWADEQDRRLREQVRAEKARADAAVEALRDMEIERNILRVALRALLPTDTTEGAGGAG